jgi:hypothetical protein
MCERREVHRLSQIRVKVVRASIPREPFAVSVSGPVSFTIMETGVRAINDSQSIDARFQAARKVGITLGCAFNDEKTRDGNGRLFELR